MGLSSKTLIRRRKAGFTLAEILTVIMVSSLLLVILALVFRTGLDSVGRSSGRIEMVRNGRQALDNIQRYLSSTINPANVFDAVTNQPLAKTKAIFVPNDFEIHDPNAGVIQPWKQRIQFFSSIDHLSTLPPLGARALVATPQNYLYEIATVPGPSNVGQDLVLRKVVGFTPWDETALPLAPDTSVLPRVIGRKLGISDSAVPGGFRDGLRVRRLDAGGLMVKITVTPASITDEAARRKIELVPGQAQPAMLIEMNTIFQPPYFNIDL